MIKLVLEIKEAKTKELENIKAIRTDVSIEEIGTNATKIEKEVSNIMKERLGIEEKVQFVNRSKNKKDVNELLKELFSI